MSEPRLRWLARTAVMAAGAALLGCLYTPSSVPGVDRNAGPAGRLPSPAGAQQLDPRPGVRAELARLAALPDPAATAPPRPGRLVSRAARSGDLSARLGTATEPRAGRAALARLQEPTQAYVPVAGSQIEIGFDGPVNQTRIQSSFRIHPTLDGSLEWLDGRTLSFRPATALAYDTVYSVEVATSGREDLAWQWTFVTVKPITVTIDDCASTAGELRSVLAVLARKRIKAIMFPTGICNATYPWLVPQMLAEGHTVCNHTYSHPRLTRLSDARIASEIRNGVSAGGCKLLRPPWGDWDGPGGRVERIAAQLGYQIMLWDVDTLDWAGASAAEMLARIRARGGVILVHFHGKYTVSTLEQL